MIQDCISDVKIVDSSLTFINDFLRSTLDMHASVENKLVIHCGPTDLMKDVLEPVRSILFHQQGGRVHVTVEGPENLLVSTDCLRLKQVSVWATIHFEEAKNAVFGPSSANFFVLYFSKGDDEFGT